jgi:hypothetical protein
LSEKDITKAASDKEMLGLKKRILDDKKSLAKDKEEFERAKIDKKNSNDLIKLIVDKEEMVKNGIVKLESDLAEKRQTNQILIKAGEEPLDLSYDEEIIKAEKARQNYWKSTLQETSGGKSGQQAIRDMAGKTKKEPKNNDEAEATKKAKKEFDSMSEEKKAAYAAKGYTSFDQLPDSAKKKAIAKYMKK